VAFRSKTNWALLRAAGVFQLCRLPFLVSRAESILNASYRFLGPKIPSALLRLSFFGHFCAGEDPKGIQPTVDMLGRNGIGSILDYAAESDSPPPAASSATASTTPQCRVYTYQDEELCDGHLLTFKKCIEAVHTTTPTGFAAVKITALGNPLLLQRMSEVICELRTLFTKFDASGRGRVSREQFMEAYSTFFTDEKFGAQAANLFGLLSGGGDDNKSNSVDYIAWSNSLAIETLHETLTSRCRQEGPLSRAVLNPEEVGLVMRMRARVDELAALASQKNVRLMIDAEHNKFQPAIDNLTLQLAQKYNRGATAVIFGTYQMYLKDSRRRLEMDMARAAAGGHVFAAKLVRGAYMVMERREAGEQGREDPVHATLQDTHDCYNAAVELVISKVGAGKVELMIATHNQHSVELALRAMQSHGLAPATSPVYFGQLLGMADHLTFTLGSAGYKAYKYVPYGKVQEVMPYLVRRAQENSGMLGGAALELKMLAAELGRRLRAGR